MGNYRAYKNKPKSAENDNPFPSADNIILQEPCKKGAYCSPLLDGQYQILESNFYDGQMVIFNHKTQELIRNKSGDSIEIFKDIASAEKHIGIGNNVTIVCKPQKKEKPAMQKTKKERAETAMSYLRELITTKPEMSNVDISNAVKQKYPNSSYTHHYCKYMRGKLGVTADPTAVTVGRGKRDRGETAMSYLREQLSTNFDKTDSEIAELVKQKYPDSTYTHHYVKYMRKKTPAADRQLQAA